MKHVRRINGPPPDDEAVAQSLIDWGCTSIFEPGWETGGDLGFMGLCRPFYRDLEGCASDCWWPAQVPDDLSMYPGWLDSCGAIDSDWPSVEFVK